MEGFSTFWDASDAIGRSVALLLLAMSVASWVTILWKGWVLRRAQRDIERAVPAFWAAPAIGEGRDRIAALDRETLLVPLIEAATATPAAGTLESGAHLDSQLTRRLRDALHRGLAHLQFGQVLLASIGSTAPFIGLFGTVVGIMNSFQQLTGSKTQSTIERVGPGIAEALFTTAVGLVAAVPAVMAYNFFLRRIRVLSADIDAFGNDFLNIVRRHLLT